MRGKVIGGELRRDTAPAERDAGADHRQLRVRVADRAQDVREQADEAEPDQHERDRQRLRARRRAPRRREHRGPDHAKDDRGHREVLVAAGVLIEHPLPEEHQHDQPERERGLHHDQRGEHQRDDLQRPAEYREAGPGQPAHPPDQAEHQRRAKVMPGGRLLRVHRLKRDP